MHRVELSLFQFAESESDVLRLTSRNTDLAQSLSEILGAFYKLDVRKEVPLEQAKIFYQVAILRKFVGSVRTITWRESPRGYLRRISIRERGKSRPVCTENLIRR
jgi:hypothetical protein